MHTTSGDNTSSPFIQEHTPMESAAQASKRISIRTRQIEPIPEFLGTNDVDVQDFLDGLEAMYGINPKEFHR